MVLLGWTLLPPEVTGMCSILLLCLLDNIQLLVLSCLRGTWTHGNPLGAGGDGSS